MLFPYLGGFCDSPIAHGVAQGLANSNLGIEAVIPLRFVVGLVVAAVSPIFAVCDLLIYMGSCISHAIKGARREALESLKDAGRLLLRFIPEAFYFPFAFAGNPRIYRSYDS